MLLLALFAVPELAASQARVSSDAAAVILRTRSTQTTYALVSTNERHNNGQTFFEFSAEYNSGDLHRVETPRDRIVANCRTHEAADFRVATGEIVRAPELATMACGIYTNAYLRSAEVTGSRLSKFGSVDQLKLVSTDSVRTYEVDSDGVIIAETIADTADHPMLVTKAISLTAQLPPGDLFSEGSLSRSVVPEVLKHRAANSGG